MRPKFAHLQPPVNPFFKDFSFLNERISFGKPDPHRYFVDGVVDVKGSWTSQSPLPPTKAGLPARSCSPETEALGATFRIVDRQTERTLLASIALPSDRVFLTKTRRRRSSSPKVLPDSPPFLLSLPNRPIYLTRTLSLVVAIASLAIAPRGAGRVATARSTPGVTVVPFRASLAPEPGVAYSARALSPVVAVGLRGAEGAGARPAPNPRHQVPGAGPAAVAVLAEGEGRAHAATCVGVADVARTYARVAGCKIMGSRFQFSFSSLFRDRYLGTRSRRIRSSRPDTCRNASRLRLACSNTGPRLRGRKSCAPRSGRIRRGRIQLPSASPRTQPFRTQPEEQDLREEDSFEG